MRIEYHASPNGERSVVIDCEDMVPGLEAKPWIDGWMRSIRHLMPDDPPGTTPCADGSSVHDFQGKSVCPSCGLSLSWYLCRQPFSPAADQAADEKDWRDELVGMSSAFMADLQVLINIYKGFVNDPDIHQANDERVARLQFFITNPSRPYPPT